jgi:hypothetical protein
MNWHTRGFLTKFAALLEEYNASLEIEGDAYGGIQDITLEVRNPQTFDQFYDSWIIEHPEEKYPWNSRKYSYADWVDLGKNVDCHKIKGLLK